MVAAAKRCYEQFPTVVNEIPESGISYTNDIRQYAYMDAKMQRAQKAIGGSSDSAQVAQSYFWDKVARNQDDEEKQRLYHDIIILAVLAQCSIDGIKRLYAVDSNDEIARIRSMPYMKRERDFPLFMKYTREIPVTKNGVERPYEDIKLDKRRLSKRIDKEIICPMNYLQNSLDKIQGASRDKMVDTYQYFKKIDGRANSRQMSKVRSIIEGYDNFIRNNIMYVDNDDDDGFDIILEKTRSVLEEIGSMKISAQTMNRLIETCLGVMGRTNTDKQYSDATKYITRTFNILYQTDKQRFLQNFYKAEK